ncbi:MAG TPA: hypothetical protein VE422_34995 [Terriglobia bacterium]|nr:hypothetical protein [Terriglobia bacterium]
MLKYKSTTGLASFELVLGGGQGTQVLGTETWATSWTTFSPYVLSGQAHILIYMTGSGVVKVLKLQPNGSGKDTIWTGAWTAGWS